MSTVNFTDNHLMRSMCESDEEKNRLENCVTESRRKQRMNELGDRDMRSLILRLEEDKKRLTQRIEKLTANEKTLVLELERIKRHDGTGLGSTKAKSAARLEEHLSGVEADRDYWRSQVELLQQMLANPALNQRNGMVTRSAGSRLRAKPPLTGQGTIKPISKSRDGIQSKLESQVQELTAERNRLRQELERANRSGLASPSQIGRSRSLSRLQQSEDLNQLTKLRQEKEDMKMMLNKLEQRVQEIQKNVHSLTVERDQLNKLYKEARAEVHRLHQDLYAIRENGDRANYNSQSALRRAETERDRVLVDLSRVTAERDGLVTKYKATVDLANKDKAHLEACIEDLTASHRQLVRDRDELVQRSSALREHMMDLESTLKDVESELKRNNEMIRAERNNNSDLQQQLDQSRRRGELVEKDLANMNAKFRECEDQLHASGTRVSQLERELRAERDDYAQLRARMEALDDEKQGLESALRETTQRLSHSEVDLSSRTRELNELRTSNEESTRAFNRAQDTLSLKTSELANTRTELNAVQSNLMEVRRLLEAEEKENTRIREEFTQLSREFQTLQTNFQDAQDEQEELKQRAKGYLSEISRLERVVSERDGECVQLMDQLRAANADCESWRSRWESSEKKLTTARIEAEDRESELVSERERADAREREVAHLKTSLNTAELQSSAMSRTAAETTEQLQMTRAELEILSSEITRLREISTRLESEKASAQRETNSQRTEIEQLRSQLDDFELELEQLREQLDQERSMNNNLQSAMQSARQKEQNAILELQEKLVEVNALKERLNAVEERADASYRESERLRERLAEAEREANRLSRSLSAEKFEKERAFTELRLNTLPTGYRPSGYSSYGAGAYPSSTLLRERQPYSEREKDY